jgi:undecaprenyl-diphosphatase
MKTRAIASLAIGATLLAAPLLGVAGGGPLGIDHVVPYDADGIWARHVQVFVEDAAIVTTLAGALWLGDQPGLGHTYWQATDSMLISGALVAIMKPTFSRARPSQGGDPGLWFQGHGHNSFPSGEVAVITSVVTPFILQYGHENPSVYALELLPLYDAAARVKSQAHWQTDVLASWLIGTGTAIYAHDRTTSLTIQVLPHGVTIGLQKRF